MPAAHMSRSAMLVPGGRWRYECAQSFISACSMWSSLLLSSVMLLQGSLNALNSDV